MSRPWTMIRVTICLTLFLPLTARLPASDEDPEGALLVLPIAPPSASKYEPDDIPLPEASQIELPDTAAREAEPSNSPTNQAPPSPLASEPEYRIAAAATEVVPPSPAHRTADAGSATVAQPPPSPSPPRKLSPQMQARRERVRNTLAIYFHQKVFAETRSPWGIMHTFLPFGGETFIYGAGKKFNAIGWLCWNGYGRKQRIFDIQDGTLAPRMGPGVQGHGAQFLALLAQSKVKQDYEIRVNDFRFTVADLIEHEKLNCQAGEELTFHLIALAHYLPSDAEWENSEGQTWNIPRLIQEEQKQPVVGVACGGTHRLMAQSYAVHKRKKRDEPIDGEWQRAEQYMQAYMNRAIRLQNSDGSFSTNWFEGRGNHRDIEKKLKTTGHILEWLIFSLPEEALMDPRIVRSVDYLTNLLLRNSTKDWDYGPRGHALRALVLYDQRVFGSPPGQLAAELSARFAKLGGRRSRR